MLAKLSLQRHKSTLYKVFRACNKHRNYLHKQKHYTQYAFEPLIEKFRLINADGSRIKTFGERWIKMEVTPGNYAWLRFIVCDVSTTIWSVSMLRRHGVKFIFANQLTHKGTHRDTPKNIVHRETYRKLENID